MGADLDYDWRTAAASALDWWRDAGVDTLVDESPRDWFARAAPRRAPAAEEPVATAPALPATIEAFREWRLGEAAPEAGWGNPRIAFTGSPGAALMVLLDMPEANDSQTGMLYSGPEGRLLDRMLAAIGHSRESVFLATVCVARPLTGAIPRDAGPRLAELAQHLVQLAAPRRVLLLGQAAGAAILGTEGDSGRGRLRAINQPGGTIEVLASLHPSLLLSGPARKAEAWKHLQLLIGGNSL